MQVMYSRRVEMCIRKCMVIVILVPPLLDLEEDPTILMQQAYAN